MAANPTIAAATGGGPAQNTPAAPEAEAPAFAILRQYWPQLKRLLPSHVIPDAWYSSVFAALYRGRTAGPGQIDLWKAANGNPESLMFALFDAARQGLEPGTPQYYLTPRPNKRATNGIEVLGIRGYQGEIELIYRGGAVSSVIVEVVREHDEYRYDADVDPVPVHRIKGGKFARKADRGKLIGVYAYGRMVDGTISKVVELNQDDIDRAKRASGSAKSGTSFWNDPDDETQMWLKGLAVDTPIPTPDGWSTMGNLSVGRVVFDRHGQQCRVTAKSHVKHLDCYRVTFANGSSIVCDAEHLWVAAVGNGSAGRRGWKTLPIGELYAAKQASKQVVMPVTGALDVPDVNLPIDPWVLGYWLGDGNRGRPVVTCNIDNQHEVIAAIASAGYDVGAVRRDPRSRAVEVNIRGGLAKQLADTGLLGHKHIPQAYLRGSARQRLALLRGLVDSDGGLGNARGRAYVYTTDPALASAVAELVRSLGEMVNVIAQPTRGYGKEVTAYRVSWQPTIAPATLSAKVARFRERTYAPYRSVKTIERIASVPTQCIAVDSPTSTYLAGEDMVPTHNTGVHRLQKYVPTSAEYRRIAATTNATAQAVATVAGKTALDAQAGATLPDAIAAAQRAALPGGTPGRAPSPIAAAPEEPPAPPLDESRFAQPPAPEDEPDPRDEDRADEYAQLMADEQNEDAP